MLDVLVSPISQECRLHGLLVCPELLESDLPGCSSAVKHGLPTWTPIDGVPGVAPGTECIEPRLGPGCTGNSQGALSTAPHDELLFPSQ